MDVIDAHAHLTKRQLYGRGSKDQLLREMERASVACALLMGEAGPGDLWFSTEELIREIGDTSELKVIAGIDVDGDIPSQVRMCESAISRGIVVGFKLYPGYQYFYPYEEKLEPVYAAAARLKVPVVIHTGDLFTEGAVRPPMLKYSHPLHVDEAAVRHPDVTFIIAHLGNPWILDATEVVFKNSNVYADLSGLFVETIEDGWATLVAARLREAIAYLGGSQKFLFGTDYPLIGHASLVAFFQKVIPVEEQERFFAQNARELFQLKI